MRALKTEVETKKAQLNAANKGMSRATPEERDTKRAELRAVGDAVKDEIERTGDNNDERILKRR